jgi:hypothetical protein
MSSIFTWSPRRALPPAPAPEGGPQAVRLPTAEALVPR